MEEMRMLRYHLDCAGNYSSKLELWNLFKYTLFFADDWWKSLQHILNDIPSILRSEVEASIKRLKRNKAPGEDNITGGILQDGGDAMIQILTDLFNTCLHHQQVPKAWKNALVVLIHKKGNTSDFKNYRPISLLPIMYKVFSNILLQRMIRTLDFHQPCEQARFRAGYSMIDHLQVVNQLQEKANEYNMPLCFAFVYYEKAFDSIEFEPHFEGLKNQGVDEAYFNPIVRQHQFYDSIRTVKNSNLEEEPDKETTSLPNCLRHVCNTPSSTTWTGKTKVSGLTVNTYPT